MKFSAVGEGDGSDKQIICPQDKDRANGVKIHQSLSLSGMLAWQTWLKQIFCFVLLFCLCCTDLFSILFHQTLFMFYLFCDASCISLNGWGKRRTESEVDAKASVVIYVWRKATANQLAKQLQPFVKGEGFQGWEWFLCSTKTDCWEDCRGASGLEENVEQWVMCPLSSSSSSSSSSSCWLQLITEKKCHFAKTHMWFCPNINTGPR